MAKFIGGTAMIIQFIDAAGTIAIQQQYTNFSWDWNTDLTEVSSGSALAKAYLPTLKDVTLSYEGYSNGTDSPLGTADLKRMEPQMSGTLIWASYGTATGKPKGGVFGYWKSCNQEYPYADSVKVKFEFQGSGELVYDPNSATF